jgi:hypothetical protein
MADPVAALLDDVDRGRWPDSDNDEAWLLLATWAFQTESLMIDEAENLAWEEQMRELLHRNLSYELFVEARMEALSARLKARKLAQANLRYRYGFKPRKTTLVRRDVRRFYQRWTSE